MQILDTLGVDWRLVLAQFINFGVLLAILSVLVYKPLLRAIDERRERIRKSLEDAEALKKETEKMEKERAKRMQEIDKEAQALLEQAKAQAEKTRKKLVHDAQDEAAQVLEKGRKQLEEERRAMLADVKSTVIAVSVQLAERVIGREFGKKDQQRILSSIEEDLPSLIK
jgi:F-type H+-transporting ATPase subunit b